ncbi:hypothetical protein ATO10_02390 [Actibacterium atlanticum]|uniref:TPM domain-containing protein n=1 Tax=Actibacterium atlanticum TaxID=1461693 RepID=A0A058ZQX5_9RHOB|nr:TPM domain-containing protein [Actibacterium atlanticum]KCV83572.1 hypothetical protein ATO10_02390 [Actibacterium atlanticum]
MFYRFAFLAALFALPAFAQDYPARPSQPISDLADLLPEDAEARLSAQITSLREETGVELLLLTLDSRTPYAAAPTMEAFATNLFNHWGIGDADRNDGILIYVARSDREMRIELGSGFGSDWNHFARDVIDSNFLPYFRDDRYAEGIERGTNAAIRDIARPFAQGAPAPEPDADNSWIIFALFAASTLLLKFRQKLGDLGTSLKPCPNCGNRGLRRSRNILSKASRTAEGRGDRVTRCRKCDYRDVTPYTIRRLSSRSSSSGGGRSSGGGASGRW